jgi:hypothetical protein
VIIDINGDGKNDLVMTENEIAGRQNRLAGKCRRQNRRSGKSMSCPRR